MAYKKYFTLSYDDGVEQDKPLVKILREYGIKATFNLNSGLFGQKDYIGRIGEYGVMPIPEKKKASRSWLKPVNHFVIPKDEVVQVYEGFEIASHGHRHELYQLSSKETIRASVTTDIELLSTLFNQTIVGHAYPFGGMTSKSAGILRETQLLYGRGVKSTKGFTFPKDPLRYQPTCWHGTQDVFSLLDQFIAAVPIQEDLLFYMWGHSYEFDYGTERNSWDRIRNLCGRIAGRDDIVYCTNAEAFQAHYACVTG